MFSRKYRFTEAIASVRVCFEISMFVAKSVPSVDCEIEKHYFEHFSYCQALGIAVKQRYPGTLRADVPEHPLPHSISNVLNAGIGSCGPWGATAVVVSRMLQSIQCRILSTLLFTAVSRSVNVRTSFDSTYRHSGYRHSANASRERGFVDKVYPQSCSS